jgi:AAA lid domain
VARLFASILCESGIREKSVIVETTAQEAKDGGTDEFRKLVAKAMGGVLFIDEAYDLDPVGDFKGKPIVNELLTLCENKRDKISVILAGYEDDFEKKFFAYNSGLKSRFSTVLFEDFDEVELSTIWTSMRQEKGWQESDGVAQVLSKRLTKISGRKGFGNAREVRKRLEEATQSAMARMGQDFSMETMKLTIEDVIGEDPRLANEKLKRIQSEFAQKIGWGRVKKNINEMLMLCGRNYERELRGQAPLEIFLNRMFLGNPGKAGYPCE